MQTISSPTARRSRPLASASGTSMLSEPLGPMLTASEVAQLLHLHVNTVKRLGDRGELPFYRVCRRGDRRYRLEDVLAFLARNR
jgi:excisionase family DNA binding protein